MSVAKLPATPYWYHLIPIGANIFLTKCISVNLSMQRGWRRFGRRTMNTNLQVDVYYLLAGILLKL